MFIIRHVAEDDGVQRDFLLEDLQPLGLATLMEHFADKKNTVRTRARVWPLGPDGERIAPPQNEMLINFDDAVPFLGLVPGGALPPQYLFGTTVLLDRNVVNLLDTGKHAGVFSWLNDPQFTINPIMDAFEGKLRSTPTLDEFCAIVRKVSELVERSLPQARRIQFDDAGLRQLHAWRLEFDVRAEKEAKFLQAAAPLLATTVEDERLEQVESRVIELCDHHGVRRGSVVLLTVMAKLYEGEAHRLIKRLLKFECAYSDGDAYNALADMRQLELMAAVNNMSGRFALLTQDQGFAALWCGLRPRVVRGSQVPNQINLDPSPDLFPRLDGDLARHLKRWQIDRSEDPNQVSCDDT